MLFRIALAVAVLTVPIGAAHAVKWAPTKTPNMTLIAPAQANPSTPGCEVKFGERRCPIGCTYVSGRCVKDK